MKTLISFVCIALFAFLETTVIGIGLAMYSILSRSRLFNDDNIFILSSLFVLAQFLSLSIAIGVRPTFKLLLATLSGQFVLYYLVQLYAHS